MKNYELTAQNVVNPANLMDNIGQVTFLILKSYQQFFLLVKILIGLMRYKKQIFYVRQRICMEQNYGLLMKLAVIEAGKTLPNAIAELREAVDFFTLLRSFK